MSEKALTTYSAPLIQIQAQTSYMTTMQWQAEALIRGGIIPSHWQSAAAVCSAMMLADELRIGRVVALRGMYNVHGKTSMDSQLMLALALPHLELWQVSGDTESCTVRSRRKGMAEESVVETTFNLDDAKALGLAGKENYRKQPKVMLQWRAISANLRVSCADLLNGIGYTHEEMGRPYVVTESGDIELDGSGVEVVDNSPSEPTPEPKKSGKKSTKKDQEETQRVDPKSVVESATPWGSAEAEKAARDHGNKVAKEKIEKQAAAAEEWFPSMPQHQWMDLALKTVGNDEFMQNTLLALSKKEGRNPENWAETAKKLTEWLTKKGQSVPPYPEEG